MSRHTASVPACLTSDLAASSTCNRPCETVPYHRACKPRRCPRAATRREVTMTELYGRGEGCSATNAPLPRKQRRPSPGFFTNAVHIIQQPCHLILLSFMRPMAWKTGPAEPQLTASTLVVTESQLPRRNCEVPAFIRQRS